MLDSSEGTLPDVMMMRAVIGLMLVAGLTACGQPSDGNDGAQTSVTIRDSNGMPLADVTAVFHRADGSVSDVVVSAANGNVTSMVAAGARVTLVLDETDPLLVTFDVQPNGAQVFQRPPALPTFNDVGTVDVTYPAADPVPAEYVIDVGCESASSANLIVPPLHIDEGCLTVGNTFHVVGHAYDATGTLVASNEQVENDAPATGGNTSVTLGPWTSDFDTLNLWVTNIPAEASTAGIGSVALFMDGIAFASRFEAEGAPQSDGTYAASDVIMNGMQAFAGTVYLGYDQVAGSGNSATATRRYFLDNVPTDITVDAAAELLPPPVRYELEGDPDRPVIVAEMGSELAGDIVAADLTYGSARWILIAPATATPENANELRVSIPALPDELAANRPTAGASAPVYILDFASVDGYAEFVSEFGLGTLVQPKLDPVLWIDQIPADLSSSTIERTITYTGLE